MIGERLRRTRRDQGRTLSDVSRVARVSVPYLSEVERGRKEASSEVLAAICDALRIDLSDLLAGVARDLAAERARPRHGHPAGPAAWHRPAGRPAAAARRRGDAGRGPCLLAAAADAPAAPAADRGRALPAGRPVGLAGGDDLVGQAVLDGLAGAEGLVPVGVDS